MCYKEDYINNGNNITRPFDKHGFKMSYKTRILELVRNIGSNSLEFLQT